MPRKKPLKGRPATALPGQAQPGLCGQPPHPGRGGMGSCPGPPSLLAAVCGDSPLVPRNAVIFGPDVIKVVPRFPANQQLRNTAPFFPPCPSPSPGKHVNTRAGEHARPAAPPQSSAHARPAAPTRGLRFLPEPPLGSPASARPPHPKPAAAERERRPAGSPSPPCGAAG